MTVRVGFLGAGLIGNYHSKQLRASGVDVHRAGVYDPDSARANAFAQRWGYTVCGSEAELLDGCDAVYVCTWTSEHPRLVAAAAARGHAVFCEKPLATTLDAAERMTGCVRDAGVVNAVGLVLRRAPAFVWARHLVRDAAAGDVMSVVFRDDQFIPIQGHYASTWRADRTKVGAGTLLEHSIHDVDLLAFVVGEVSGVSAHTANHHGHDGIEDVAVATVQFAGGALGTLSSVWHDNLARPSLRRVEVFCRTRHVVVDGDDWLGPVTWTDTDGSTTTLGGDELVEAVAPLLAATGTNADGAFITAAATSTPASPDFATALRAHRVVDAMYRSAAHDGNFVQV